MEVVRGHGQSFPKPAPHLTGLIRAGQSDDAGGTSHPTAVPRVPGQACQVTLRANPRLHPSSVITRIITLEIRDPTIVVGGLQAVQYRKDKPGKLQIAEHGCGLIRANLLRTLGDNGNT